MSRRRQRIGVGGQYYRRIEVSIDTFGQDRGIGRSFFDPSIPAYDQVDNFLIPQSWGGLKWILSFDPGVRSSRYFSDPSIPGWDQVDTFFIL